MKVFICCLIGSVFYLALADANNAEGSVRSATDKISDSKPKRDASLVNTVYHGPSYKYLPPVSSSYDSYPGSVGSSGGFSGGHIFGLAGGYRSGSFGHGHRYHGLPSSGNYNIGTSHSIGHHDTSAGYGQGSKKYFISGLKGAANAHSSATLGHGEFAVSRPHSHTIGHGDGLSGSSVSSLEHNLHAFLRPNTASGSGHYFSKGVGGSLSSLESSGFGLAQGLSSSVGSGLDEEHHIDHVHNGAPEHVYVISNVPAGIRNTDNYVGQQGNHVISTSSYLPSVKQHPIPSSSYGVPISNTADAYSTSYHSQASAGIEHRPAYAAGHKGLGYFSFMVNKPNALHNGISGLNLQQPSYSKVPFRPSVFLGAKLEDSAHNNDLPQQYLPPSGAGSDSTGYDYPIPTGPSINYQEPGYEQSVEIQSVSGPDPDTLYLHPQHNLDSLNEIHSAPSSNYLPPSNSYGVPYSN